MLNIIDEILIHLLIADNYIAPLRVGLLRSALKVAKEISERRLQESIGESMGDYSRPVGQPRRRPCSAWRR